MIGLNFNLGRYKMNAEILWALSPAIVQAVMTPSVLIQVVGTGFKLVRYLTYKEQVKTIIIHERLDEEENAVLVSTEGA